MEEGKFYCPKCTKEVIIIEWGRSGIWTINKGRYKEWRFQNNKWSFLSDYFSAKWNDFKFLDRCNYYFCGKCHYGGKGHGLKEFVKNYPNINKKNNNNQSL